MRASVWVRVLIFSDDSPPIKHWGTAADNVGTVQCAQLCDAALYLSAATDDNAFTLSSGTAAPRIAVRCALRTSLAALVWLTVRKKRALPLFCYRVAQTADTLQRQLVQRSCITTLQWRMRKEGVGEKKLHSSPFRGPRRPEAQK